MMLKGAIGLAILLFAAMGVRSFFFVTFPVAHPSSTSTLLIEKESSALSSATSSSVSEALFRAPLSQARARVTKKPFGLYVSPRQSPMNPERFQGYHVGVDFEAFPEEEDAEVSVYAVCDGHVREKRWVSGYGGILVQDCLWQGELVTVLYGHVKVASIPVSVGDVLSSGTAIGVLGKGFSPETDGERKHLHLGVHRGTRLDLRGYVKTQTETRDWLDVLEFLP